MCITIRNVIASYCLIRLTLISGQVLQKTFTWFIVRAKEIHQGCGQFTGDPCWNMQESLDTWLQKISLSCPFLCFPAMSDCLADELIKADLASSTVATSAPDSLPPPLVKQWLIYKVPMA